MRVGVLCFNKNRREIPKNEIGARNKTTGGGIIKRYHDSINRGQRSSSSNVTDKTVVLTVGSGRRT